MTMQPLFSEEEREELRNAKPDPNGIYTLAEALAQSQSRTTTPGLTAAIATLPPTTDNPTVSAVYIEFVPGDEMPEHGVYVYSSGDTHLEVADFAALWALVTARGHNPSAPIWSWQKVAE